jgi:hypothetical protein
VAEETGRGPLSTVRRHTLIYGSGYVATAAVSLVLVPVFARLRLRVLGWGFNHATSSVTAVVRVPQHLQPSSTTLRGDGR